MFNQLNDKQGFQRLERGGAEQKRQQIYHRLFDERPRLCHTLLGLRKTFAKQAAYERCVNLGWLGTVVGVVQMQHTGFLMGLWGDCLPTVADAMHNCFVTPLGDTGRQGKQMSEVAALIWFATEPDVL